MTTLQALDWRYATQEFSDKKLSNEQLNLILEAARKAPSSMNFQPWKFVVVEDKTLRAKVREAGFDQPKITDSSHLLVIAAKNDLGQTDVDAVIEATKKERGVSESDLDGYRNMLEGFVRGKDKEFYAHWCKQQSYIALGFVLLAAAENQIDAGPMGGFEPEKVSQILGLETLGYTATALVALGFRSPQDETQQRGKVRFSQEDVVIRK